MLKLFVIVVFIGFSDHQQRIQPPFRPSVLSSPLPLQVSLWRACAAWPVTPNAATLPALSSPPPDRTLISSPRQQHLPCRRTLASRSSAACSSRPSTLPTPRQDSRTGCLPMVTHTMTSSFRIKTCQKIHLAHLECFFFYGYTTFFKVKGPYRR